MLVCPGGGGDPNSHPLLCSQLAASGIVVAVLIHEDGTCTTAIDFDGAFVEQEQVAVGGDRSHEERAAVLNEVRSSLAQGHTTLLCEGDGSVTSISIDSFCDTSRCILAGHSIGGYSAL